jgi:hypothetical protein
MYVFTREYVCTYDYIHTHKHAHQHENSSRYIQYAESLFKGHERKSDRNHFPAYVSVYVCMYSTNMLLVFSCVCRYICIHVSYIQYAERLFEGNERKSDRNHFPAYVCKYVSMQVCMYSTYMLLVFSCVCRYICIHVSYMQYTERLFEGKKTKKSDRYHTLHM